MKVRRQFIPASEAAQILGVSKATFLRMVRNGEIAAIPVGGNNSGRPGKLLVNIDRFEKTFGVKVEER